MEPTLIQAKNTIVLFLLIVITSCNVNNKKQEIRKSFKIEEVVIAEGKYSSPRLGVKIKCSGIKNANEISQVNIYGVGNEYPMSTHIENADSLFFIYVNEPYRAKDSLEILLLQFKNNRVFARLIINDTAYYAECDSLTKFYIKKNRVLKIG